ncbi:hypothetical protein QAD02_024314 [Eretmocerus hayati]|uniref:Uncharacterized protein n=1 Tax=Eretmocerus hayati TaxID=131215 RepID=A0ACC2Q0X0_9HYME|nr:hypothetical protein QAD02_024314 [Eretmocerus hayati]
MVSIANLKILSQQKRKMPKALENVLAADVFLTDQFVKRVEKFLPLRQLRTHYQILEYSCHGLLWFPLWIAFIWIFSKRSLYQMQVNLFIGLILDVILVAVIKAYTRRRRPAKNQDSFEIGPDKFSFPSGHTSRAFFIACFFLYNSPLYFIFIPPLLCWVVSVSISRVLMRRHHLLDVAAGAILGVIESYLIGLIYLEHDTCADLIWWLTDEKLDGGEYHV